MFPIGFNPVGGGDENASASQRNLDEEWRYVHWKSIKREIKMLFCVAWSIITPLDRPGVTADVKWPSEDTFGDVWTVQDMSCL